MFKEYEKSVREIPDLIAKTEKLLNSFIGYLYKTISKKNSNITQDHYALLKEFITHRLNYYMNPIIKSNTLTHNYYGICSGISKSIKVTFGGKKTKKLKNYK